MNRKEASEYLRNVLANIQSNLEPEEIAALIQAKEELEKNCANCERLYRNGSRGDYCGIYEMRIGEPNNWFCADHEEGDNFLEPL